MIRTIQTLSSSNERLEMALLFLLVFHAILICVRREVEAAHESYRTMVESRPSITSLSCYIGIQNYEQRQDLIARISYVIV